MTPNRPPRAPARTPFAPLHHAGAVLSVLLLAACATSTGVATRYPAGGYGQPAPPAIPSTGNPLIDAAQQASARGDHADAEADDVGRLLRTIVGRQARMQPEREQRSSGRCIRSEMCMINQTYFAKEKKTHPI